MQHASGLLTSHSLSSPKVKPNHDWAPCDTSTGNLNRDPRRTRRTPSHVGSGNQSATSETPQNRQKETNIDRSKPKLGKSAQCPLTPPFGRKGQKLRLMPNAICSEIFSWRCFLDIAQLAAPQATAAVRPQRLSPARAAAPARSICIILRAPPDKSLPKAGGSF